MQDSGENITFSKRDLKCVCKNTSLLTYYNISTSELRVRLMRCETDLSPPVKYFYRPFQGGASFVDHLCYFCLVFCYAFVS